MEKNKYKFLVFTLLLVVLSFSKISAKDVNQNNLKTTFLLRNSNSFLTQVVDSLIKLENTNFLQRMTIATEITNKFPTDANEALSNLNSTNSNLLIWENNDSLDTNVNFLLNASKNFDRRFLLKFLVHERKGCLSRNKNNLINWLISVEYFYQNDIQQSLNFANKILLQNENCFDDILFHKAFCHYFLRETEEAFKISNQILENNPNHLKSLWILASKGKNEEKKKYLNRILRIDNNLADMYVGLGAIIFSEAKYQEAIKIFKKAIKINPDYVNPYFYLGWVYEEKKEYEKAKKYQLKVLELDSTYSDAYLRLGCIARGMEKYEEAYQYFLKEIEFDSTNWEAYYWIGDLLYNMEISLDPIKVINEAQLDDAQWYFEKVVEFRPDLSEIQFKLGVLKSRNLNYTEAIKNFLQAVKYDSTSKALGHLSLAYLKLEDFENADKYYKKAFASDSVYVKILMDTSEVSILEKYYKHQPKPE